MMRRVAGMLGLGIAAWLQGCASPTQAPVVDRTGSPTRGAPQARPAPSANAVLPVPPPGSAPGPDSGVEVRPLAPSGEAPAGSTGATGSYTIKPGDTLFSIARNNGVSVRDLAAWNNLEDAGSIRVGQQLRLSAPGTVAEGAAAAPAILPPATVAGDGRPADVPPPADGNVKTQPLGMRVPYSDQAYAQMSKQPLPAPATADAGKPADTASAKPEVPRADGEVDWAWPVQGKVVANFNESTMKGIAIAGNRGTPIHASAAGRVIFAGTGIRGLGQLVVVRHNATYSSVYAHNDRILVKEGQNVTRGQVIAEMGSSDSDTVKLHFEIRRQGRPLDPIKFLPNQ